MYHVVVGITGGIQVAGIASACLGVMYCAIWWRFFR
jgi:hypothetical protein